MKKALSIALRIGISAVLLFILFRKIDFKATLEVLSHLNLAYFTLAVIIFLVITGLVFYRWRMLLKAQDVDLPSLRILSSFSGGIFFSLFLPSTIGGDVARTLDLSLHTKKKSVIAATVLLDRLSGFVGLVIVAIVSLALGHKLIDEPEVYWIVFILTALLGAIILIMFNQGIYKRFSRKTNKENKSSAFSPFKLLELKNTNMKKVLDKFLDSLNKLHSEIYFFRSHPEVLGLNILYSVIIQGGSAVVSYFLLRGLNVKINMLYPMVFNPVVTVITTIPISIGGLGLRDASSVFFYTKIGIDKNIALAQSLLNFALIVGAGLIGGIIYVSTFHYRRIQSHQADARPG